MASPHEVISMALFCDFENIALGVRDANYDKFDIGKVLERLLLKGSIVVKKAYCDWERYKAFKAPMHEASFELIEIPHVRQSGKNSADIRMVVDALDLCYTKGHVDAFVIISGDSDFSPLVSKLRENAKTVIGVGVKNSTSDLLIANCDEFIYYDDLVREQKKTGVRRGATRSAPAARSRSAAKKGSAVAASRGDAPSAAAAHPGEGAPPGGDAQSAIGANPGADVPAEATGDAPHDEQRRRDEAVDLVVGTIDALLSERGADEKIWGSMIKQALKRRKPGFSESYYGFRSFNALLEEAAGRGELALDRDEKSGGYIVRLVTAEG
jgi:uncharacterized protein (TIGR00288 family)